LFKRDKQSGGDKYAFLGQDESLRIR
jgi:hypothetical protein